MKIGDRYGEGLPDGRPRRPPVQRPGVVATPPAQPAAPAAQVNRPTRDSLAASAAAALNPPMQSSFRAGGEGSAFQPQYQYTGSTLPEFFGDEAMRAREARPFFRAFGAGRSPPVGSNVPLSDPRFAAPASSPEPEASSRARVLKRFRGILGF